MIVVPTGAVYEFDHEVPDGWDEPAPVEVVEVTDHPFDPDLRTVHVRDLDTGEQASHYADEFLSGYRKVADSTEDYEVTA